MKKKNGFSGLFRTLLILAALLFCTLAVHADFGDFGGDVDYGGDDYGGDYDYDGWNDYDGDGSSSDDTDGLVAAVVIGGIVYFAVRSKKRGGSTKNAGAKRTDPATLSPMENYTILDPNFNEDAFCEKLSNLYVKMQEGWQNKDIEPLRPYFTDAYFNQMLKQLDGLRRQGVTNRVERIAVLGVQPLGYVRKNNEDHIIVELRTRITDYTVRDSDNSVVSGSPDKQLFMTYEWDLCRASGQKTEVHEGMNVITCPNCGASVDINASAKCPYCDSVITIGASDWAICRISGIQRVTG